MIQVSLKIKGSEPCQTECFAVESIFTECFEEDKVVLHFVPKYNFKELLNMALEYNWELYRYPSDGHVGLTINLDEIFRVKTIESVNEG
jgi:hypothetical protein